jgi:hypothetical protein
VRRAWTPNHGGLPGLAEKPLNDKLDVRVRIGVSVVGSSSDAIHVVRGEAIRASGNVRDDVPARTTTRVTGVPGGVFPSSVVAVGGFGFTLSASEPGAKFGHLGRYIGALRFGLSRADYDPGSGETVVDALTSVWAPDTVERAAVAYRIRPIVLQLGPGLEAHPKHVVGAVCQNSRGAPFFSTWRLCGSADKGPERDTDVTALTP